LPDRPLRARRGIGELLGPHDRDDAVRESGGAIEPGDWVLIHRPALCPARACPTVLKGDQAGNRKVGPETSARRRPALPYEATKMIAADVVDLHALPALLPADEYNVRLTVDTNTLIDNPDLAAHTPTVGGR